MEVQSRILRNAAAKGDLAVCLEARNAGGAVTFVPQDAPVSLYAHVSHFQWSLFLRKGIRPSTLLQLEIMVKSSRGWFVRVQTLTFSIM